MQPVTEQGGPSPSVTPREVHAPLMPAGTVYVLPAVTGTTPAATPSPGPFAVRTLRTDAGLIKHLPIASFTITPSEGTTPLSVACDASASAGGQGSIISSAWNFGDGTTAGGMAVTHVYTQAGNYTVTLVVTDNASQSATTMRLVNVSAPAAAVRINPEKPPVRMLQPVK
jgi:PKD repeat protein